MPRRPFFTASAVRASTQADQSRDSSIAARGMKPSARDNAVWRADATVAPGASLPVITILRAVRSFFSAGVSASGSHSEVNST